MSDRDELPRRSGSELAAALLVRAALLSGASWEVPATVVMMREAAEYIQREQAILTQLRDEMRDGQKCAYELYGPKSPRGHDFKRWADALDQILSGQPEP